MPCKSTYGDLGVEGRVDSQLHGEVEGLIKGLSEHSNLPEEVIGVKNHSSVL